MTLCREQILHHAASCLCPGGDEAVMAYMQQHARRTLRALRPDNYTPFAELFVAALLQAAATGESLPDSELEALATKNAAKFYRLNQRMQASGVMSCVSNYVALYALSAWLNDHCLPCDSTNHGASLVTSNRPCQSKAGVLCQLALA